MSDSDEIRTLLDQGLTHYGLGEVQKALGVWRRVLDLEPGNPRAMEYIRFVEENWAPNQGRKEDAYRPDEGTDPKAKGAAEAAAEAADEAEAPAPNSDSDGRQAKPSEPLAPDDYVPPVKSEGGNWGDLYDFNKNAAADPSPVPEPVPEPIPEPVSASIPEPIPGPPPTPAPEPTAAPEPIAAPDGGGLPPEAQGDEGFASWDSQVWNSAPPPTTGSSLPAVPEEKVEQIESSTLPARPEPPEESLDGPLPEPPTPEPPVAETPPVASAQTAEDAGADPEDRPATDGWGTLGAPVKTDPELRIDPGLQSAFSRPPSEPQKLVIQPTPPFSESQPPPVDEPPAEPTPAPPTDAPADVPAAQPAADPLFDGQLPAALDFPAADEPVPMSGPELDVERFSLDTTPPPSAPSALGLVGGGGGAGPEIEDEEVSGEFDSVTALMHGVNDMLELDDFSGAVELLDKVLDQDPDHAEAARLREEAEGELIKMYESKIGEMSKAPEVRMASDEIIWLNLDHRAGFLLSMIDGQTSYEDIMAVAGLPQLDVLRILVQLLQEKVIDVS